jgi:glycosyltransferase involved in cell wall biosynthesis
MRIFQVCSALGNLRGGAERFCLKLSNILVTQGHEVSLITGRLNPSTTKQLQKGRLNPFYLTDRQNKIPRKILFDYINLQATREFTSILGDYRPDLVHFHSFYGLSSHLALISSRNVPTVITMHDAWCVFIDGAPVTPRFNLTNNIWKLPFGIFHRLVNVRHLQSSTIVSPSNWLKQFTSKSGLPVSKVIPNGVTKFQLAKRYENEIIYVGDLNRGKGLRSIIAPLVSYAQRYNWLVTVLGEGPDLCSLKKDHSNIRFVGYQNPERYYARASILVVPSLYWENFPTVVLEGMSAALCVIGHNVGGISELLTHQKTGFLYNNISEFQHLLSKLLPDAATIRRVGQNAQIESTQLYGWTDCASRYIGVYEDSCENFSFSYK